MGLITTIAADGNDHLIASSAYGTCGTAAGTATKVVSFSNFDTLTPGVTIHVLFTYSNTSSSPTLNVNSTGAKPIYKYGTTAPGTTAATSWNANSIVSFTYNTSLNSSGCWLMNDHLDDTNTQNAGTVTSVRVQATSPVQSSTSTAQSSSLNTTISLADGYGDTKNPYASKTKNTVLAAGATADSVPSFRTLVADDIPSITTSKISDFPTIPTKTSDLTNDSGFITSDSDQNVKVSNVSTSKSYYLTFLDSSNTPVTKDLNVNVNNLNYNLTSNTSQLVLGSNASNTNARKGSVVLNNPGGSSGEIVTGSLTSARTYTFPDKTGTVSLTSDIPSNISAFTNDAGYITSADVPEGASAYTGTISAVGTSASSGTNNGFARGDHVHNITKSTIDTTLGTGSGTTKFYREDGSWATPAYTTNTDTKLQIGAVTSGTTYYPIVAANSTTAATRQYDATGIAYTGTNGTANGTNGNAVLQLGNNTASTSANWKKGTVRLYGTTAYYTDIVSGAPSANRTITLPNKTGTVALTNDIPSVPTSAASSTTGISIANHGTGTVIGVQSSTTTASKVTLGTAISVPNVTSTGSASTWAFEEVSIPNVTSAGSASSWTFEEKSIPNVTAVGSGSFTQGSFSGGSGSFTSTVTNHVLSFSHTHTAATHGADSHTHTAPTIGTAIKVQSKSGGSNGSAPTLGTAIKVQSKTSGSNGSAPTLGTAISVPNVTGVSDVTVPIKNSSASTFVTGTTHTITDNGHTHSLS